MSFRGEQVIKGTTYVFEAIAQWDSEKHQSRQKHIYIGKKDPVMGAFLPNKKYYELYGENTDTANFQASSVMKSVDFGEYHLTEIPRHLDDTDRSFCEDLLPWSPSFPEHCRKPDKNSNK